MKQSRNIQGSIDKCWEVLLESLQYDYKEATGKTLKKEKIKKGLNYTKNLKPRIGKEGEVAVEISELDKYYYKATITSNRGDNTILYKLTPLDDQEFTLLYEEEYFSDKKANNWNQKVMEWLYTRSIKKRTKLTFDKIETIVKEKDK